MADHDQRVKALLCEFLEEFFQLFFPAWAARFDTVEWLDKEIFPDPPQGQRRLLDVVAKLVTREAVPAPAEPGTSWLVLIHIEIEHADTVARLRPRMFDYYHLLRRKHQLPVLPIGFYLRVGLDGIGHDTYEERFWELPVLRFEYLYVGLPALPAEPYVGGDNWLGVALAALMRIPADRKAWLAAEALRRIKECPHNEWRRFLLGEFVQAYLPLDEDQRREYERLLSTEPYQGVHEMTTTWNEKGIEQGREQGREQGERKILLVMLEDRFGPLTESVRARLQAMSEDRLVELGRLLLRAQSLQDLGLEDESH